MSPTQRTIRSLKQQGRLCGIVERFIQNPVSHGIRSDLFGFIDIICLSEDSVIGIQCCGSDFAAHYRKIVEERTEYALEWLKCGGKIELWAWRKIKLKRGGKAMRWQPRIVAITEADFIEEGQCENVSIAITAHGLV